MTRERLPQRRQAEVIEFVHDGFAFTASVGFHPDGRPAEVFLTGPKTGTALQIAVHDAAIAVSLALQHGCPVETLRRAFLRDALECPAGVLGHLLDILAEAER